MRTLYYYDENITNLLLFIVLVVALILLTKGLFCFLPLLKQCFGKQSSALNSITRNNRIIIKAFVVFSILFLIAGIVTISMVIYSQQFRWHNTDIESCNSVSGKIENFRYETIEYREIVGFECELMVSGFNFSFDVPVSQQEAISSLLEHPQVVIYYRIVNEMYIVIQIDEVTHAN